LQLAIRRSICGGQALAAEKKAVAQTTERNSVEGQDPTA
jgi:hypothetical protein